jgi:signal transduction histidine kinase
VKLQPKFALLFVSVSAIPLAIAGFSSWRASQEALEEAIRGHERLVAAQAAEFVASHLGNLRSTLQSQARVLDSSRARGALPSGDVLAKFLQLIYHQSDELSAVLALDEQGADRAPPAFQAAPRPGSVLGEHEAIAPEDLTRVAAAVPLAEILATGAAFGPILAAGPRGGAHAVLSVRYDPLPGEPPTVLAALASLRRLDDYVISVSRPDRDVMLLDAASRVIAAGHRLDGPRFERKEHPAPRPDWPGEQIVVATYASGGRAVIGAFAPVPGFPVGVLVERRLETALGPVRRLGLATVYWMSVSGLLASIVGIILARRLALRVGDLAQGARRIAKGKLETRLKVPAHDELGDLARAFNAMTTSLESARTEILRQTKEITDWNETLEKRVEEKTNALRAAQDMLLRSRSLTAIGSLGAGVAHEINNPLAGVLGLTQLLLTDMPDQHPARPMLQDIEEQALRIQSIVANLLRLAQRQAGEGYRSLEIAKVIEDAFELCGRRSFADLGITVSIVGPRPSPLVRGSPAELQAAFIQLIQNARGAMEGGGKLEIEVLRPDPGLVRVRVVDTGRGISADHLPRIFDPFFTTKGRRDDTGIGLSVVHKIVEDHGGSIRVESTPGHGATFWLDLPVDKGGSHLA